MRRASKRFWLLVSAALVALAMQVGSGAGGQKRVNELTLAGLRPGNDSLEKASKRFGKESKIGAPDDPNAHSWPINCFFADDLEVGAEPNGIIRNVTVCFSSNLTGRIVVDCDDRVASRKFRSQFGSGRSLLPHDRCGRIEEIYGRAESRSPSVKGNDKLELYLYKFDWTGTDVPQVMEVSCDASSQTVAQITLAAATL